MREANQETVIDYELDTMVCQNYFCQYFQLPTTFRKKNWPNLTSLFLPTSTPQLGFIFMHPHTDKQQKKKSHSPSKHKKAASFDHEKPLLGLAY